MIPAGCANHLPLMVFFNLMHITLTDLAAMPRIPQLTLINSITGFKSANLIGTISGHKIPNLAMFSSAIHLGSDPALIGLVTRPVDGALKTTRHTYQNIRETGFFTINHAGLSFIREAHQTSASYPDGVSEFEVTGLTTEYSALIPAPYVAESTIKMGLEYVEEYAIKANGTILFIGKVVELFLPDACLDDNGNLNLQEAGTAALSGLDTYYAVEQVARLAYARV
jgi:flavin reductase (DIM6/NTAB) family NADH-FMN oxidoreductase RutF